MDIKNLLNSPYRIIIEDATTSALKFEKLKDNDSKNQLEVTVKGVHEGMLIEFTATAFGIDTKGMRPKNEAPAQAIPPGIITETIPTPADSTLTNIDF